MKNFRTLSTLCFLTLAIVVNAQVAKTVDTEGWKGVRFSYNSYTLDERGIEYDAISGFELGFVKAFSISQIHPLFLETGASFVYTNGDIFSEDGLDLSLNMVSLNVPFNFGYKVALGNKISLFPYAGLSLKGHLSGEMEMSYYGKSEVADIFDEDEMGDDSVFKRFQIGWQVGAAFNIDRFNVGLSYGTDFMEISKNVSTTTFKISAGIYF